MAAQLGKGLALGAALVMATLFLNPVFADDSKAFKIRFAGGLMQNVLQAQVDAMGIPIGVERRSIALGKGLGTFGRVDIMVVASDGPPVSARPCPDGLIKVADIVENNLLLTFNDLSLLYGNGSGVVCLNPLDPAAPAVAEIDGNWNGGTGRFANAGGDWSLRIDVAERIGTATQFIAETAVITGHLTGLHDD